MKINRMSIPVTKIGPDFHVDNTKQIDFVIEKDFVEVIDTVDPVWAGCFVTDPVHGGKVTCHRCNGFIQEKDHVGYWLIQHRDEFPKAHFHKDCFNRYEHYYGLDRPLD